jgi:hypothetical protein
MKAIRSVKCIMAHMDMDVLSEKILYQNTMHEHDFISVAIKGPTAF